MYLHDNLYFIVILYGSISVINYSRYHTYTVGVDITLCVYIGRQCGILDFKIV
jgi:hypothetical protein